MGGGADGDGDGEKGECGDRDAVRGRVEGNEEGVVIVTIVGEEEAGGLGEVGGLLVGEEGR